MEKYIINGGIKLDGKVKISSAKNSVLPMLAATVLTREIIVIKSCPKITDVLNMVRILDSIGVKAEFSGEDLIVDPSGLCGYSVEATLTRELRSSVFMLGALVSAVGKAEVSYPGGCKIGARPIDFSLNAFKELGIDVTETENGIICTSKKVCGNSIRLSFPSVSATENVILSSVFCVGETSIINAAREPEIVDLANFLNSMGAKISGAGGKEIRIKGVKKLHGTVYRPIPDRIETGTFVIAAAITGGDLQISNVMPQNISLPLHKLCNYTCKIEVKNDIIRVKGGKERRNFSFETGPYPFFPTDMQSQTMALCCVSQGVSVITENVFESRFGVAKWLNTMGADIKICNRSAIVTGVKKLYGTTVKAEDLRGGAALVLAGLCAEGVTVVENVGYIQRGYCDFDKKLKLLGANIKIRR